MYEFEHEKVPETLSWEKQRGQDTMNEYIGGTYGPPRLSRRLPPRLPAPGVLIPNFLSPEGEGTPQSETTGGNPCS